MKKLIVAVVLMLSACAPIQETVKNSDFYYFGVNTKMVKEANYWKVGAGVLTSVAVHTAGHYIYAGMTNMDVKQDGFLEVVDGSSSRREKREFSQAGHILQNGVGLILTSIPKTRQSDFTKGYVAAAWVETAFYPALFRKEGDLNISHDNGGNADLEYGVNLLLATHNMLRVKWSK